MLSKRADGSDDDDDDDDDDDMTEQQINNHVLGKLVCNPCFFL